MIYLLAGGGTALATLELKGSGLTSFLFNGVFEGEMELPESQHLGHV